MPKETTKTHVSSVDSWHGYLVNVCHGSSWYTAGPSSSYTTDSTKSKRMGKECRFQILLQ